MVQITMNGKVFLILPEKSFKARRYLGYIDADTFHCLRNPDKHLFRQMNAYGFCYELMRDGSFLGVVVHLPSGETLVTTRQRILALGEILNFKSHSLEMQIFLRIELFGGEDNIPEDTNYPQQPPPADPSDTSPAHTDKVVPRDNQQEMFGGEK